MKEDNPTNQDQNHSNTQSTLSAREEKDLKRQENQAHREKERQAILTSRKRKQMLQRSVWAIVLLGIVFGLYKYIANMEKPYTATEIHWHADVDIELCGVRKDLPRVPSGDGHFGTLLTHTHDDNKLHLEGRIFKKQDASVGLFLDAIGVDYSETELYGKKSGDMCDDKPGSVRSYLNDNEVTVSFMKDYVVKDGDVIKLVFV